jgi:hypothetical protein
VQRRRAGHKSVCGDGKVKSLTLKLAERALAVKTIVDQLWVVAILVLELLDDRQNAHNFVVKVKCVTQTADMPLFFRRMLAGEANDPNAQLVLALEAFERVPIDQAPARTRQTAAAAREKLVRDRCDAEGQPTGEQTPVAAFYFTAEKDGAGADGAISIAFALPEWTLAWMNSDPKMLIRSSMLDDHEIDVDLTSVRE